MIEFRKLDIEDKDTIQRYTLTSSRKNCDLTFANLYGWRFRYLTQIAEHKGFLLIKFYIDNEPAYMLPVGEGDLREAIVELMDDARRAGTAFRMFGICTEHVKEIEEMFPGKFTLTPERDYADYIYTRSDLAMLQGKKFQPKRNHINKFKKSYPDYKFMPLTEEMVGECMKLEAQWCKANNCSENENLQEERKAMSIVLANRNELDICGGVLLVGEKIIGFTYGAPINNEIFDTCVEKADTSYEGAYAMINNEFANMIPQQYAFINREEDLGIEGLRKAKMSYNPHTILEKYRLEER